jgi:hypothetical protein
LSQSIVLFVILNLRKEGNPSLIFYYHNVSPRAYTTLKRGGPPVYIDRREEGLTRPRPYPRFVGRTRVIDFEGTITPPTQGRGGRILPSSKYNSHPGLILSKFYGKLNKTYWPRLSKVLKSMGSKLRVK